MSFVPVLVLAALGLLLVVQGVRQIIKPTQVSRRLAAFMAGSGGVLVLVCLLVVVAVNDGADVGGGGAGVSPSSVATAPSAPTPVGSSSPADDGSDVVVEGCGADFDCRARLVMLDAVGPCSRAIERLAKYDFEWTDGWTVPRFSLHRPDGGQGGIMFLGDRVKMQNGFGAWSPMRYGCVFDPERKSVVDVTLEPGRL